MTFYSSATNHLEFDIWVGFNTNLKTSNLCLNDLKYEDNLKNEDDLKNKDNFKNEDDLKNEYDIKNEGNLNKVDNPKNYLTPHLDSHSTTDPKVKMLSAV